MIRMLIVDDHPLFREGLRAIFLSVEDIEVVGEASNGREAITQTHVLQPDLILMDIQMPDMRGIDACKTILEHHPAIHIVMLTMLEDSDSLFSAMRAGARGYILKGADKEEVLKTIRATARGDLLFSTEIARRVMGFFQQTGQGVRPVSSPFSDLTEREHEILDRIAQGKSNGAIAEEFGITIKTVSNHISNIFNKLQVTDRAQAVIKARDAGMGRDT